MLDALRLKLDRAGSDNVEVVEAGFLTYEHQGRPADIVYSRYALHHIPDLWKGVALARHVRDEHSTCTWVFEAMAERARFVVEQADYSDDGIFAKYVLRR